MTQRTRGNWRGTWPPPMKPAPKRRKSDAPTDYAYQNRETKLWYTLGDVAHEPSSYRGKSLAAALKTPTRLDINEAAVLVVAGRFVRLSTNTKRSAKRTR